MTTSRCVQSAQSHGGVEEEELASLDGAHVGISDGMHTGTKDSNKRAATVDTSWVRHWILGEQEKAVFGTRIGSEALMLFLIRMTTWLSKATGSVMSLGNRDKVCPSGCGLHHLGE